MALSPQRHLRFCHFALGLRSLTDVHENCGIGKGQRFLGLFSSHTIAPAWCEVRPWIYLLLNFASRELR